MLDRPCSRNRWKNTHKHNYYFCCFACSGLCSVFRSRAGDPDTLRAVVNEGREENDPAAAASAERLVSDRHEDHAHNSHWLEEGEGGPSRFVAYYDAASLYPSSGEQRPCALFPPQWERSKASIEAYPIFPRGGTEDRRRLAGDARVSATAKSRRRTVDC